MNLPVATQGRIFQSLYLKLSLFFLLISNLINKLRLHQFLGTKITETAHFYVCYRFPYKKGREIKSKICQI